MRAGLGPGELPRSGSAALEERAALTDDRRLAAAAERFGTPFYLYDFDLLETTARRLRAALPERVEIDYAVKANPSLAVVRLFASLGFGADVASRGELLTALAAGVPPARILIAGPAKSDADLEAAVAAGVAAIHVEGAHEVERLAAIADRRGTDVTVGVRLRPPWRLREGSRIVGGTGKFGVAPEEAHRLLEQRARWPRLRFTGVHAFHASNVRDAGALLANARGIVDLALAAHRATGLPLRLIDFGGGLGVPYRDGETPLDLAALGRGFSALMRRAEREPALAECRFAVEPGRYLTAPAGTYVTRVVEVKQTREGHHVLVDGGVHHLLRPALIGGAAHPVRMLGTAGAARGTAVTVAGPLCTALDVLAGPLPLPLPKPGDLLAVGVAGAYGYTESMPLFLSHPWAHELGCRGEEVERLRTPPTVEELLRGQCMPPALVAPPRSGVRCLGGG